MGASIRFMHWVKIVLSMKSRKLTISTEPNTSVRGAEEIGLSAAREGRFAPAAQPAALVTSPDSKLRASTGWTTTMVNS